MTKTSDLFPMPASPQNLPVFRTLGSNQSEAILVRNGVGRIAFVVDGYIQMLPINYVFLNGWIYGRTAAPAYLPSRAPVAFEVEERIENREWRSVVVNGQLDMVESSNTDGKSGPLFHDQLFCIRALKISGRASLPVESRFFAASAG